MPHIPPLLHDLLRQIPVVDVPIIESVLLASGG